MKFSKMLGCDHAGFKSDSDTQVDVCMTSETGPEDRAMDGYV